MTMMKAEISEVEEVAEEEAEEVEEEIGVSMGETMSSSRTKKGLISAFTLVKNTQ